MGGSNSKHRYKTSPATSGGKSSRQADDSPHTSLSWREMDGPSFYCNYLGFSPISKPPTSMAVLQTPVRDMYYRYRKSPSTGRSATLRLTQRGILVVQYDDGNIHSEIFLDFSAVVFVEAASFAPVKSSSERKPKAFFLPLDQEVGGGGKPGVGMVLEKHAFFVEKGFQFLVSSSHPPLVVCVARRPQGVKALDCHIFALDTVENALHISGLVASAQTSPVAGVPAGGMVTGGVGGGRGAASFDKTRGSGDVIRTEYGEYSVYRGAHQPPPHEVAGMQAGHAPPRMMPGGGGGGGAVVPPGGRNGYLGGGVPGGIVLTQDNFMSDSSSDHHHHHQHQLQQSQQYLQHQQAAQYAADLVPRGRPGPQHHPGGGGGYHNRPPDVIMHARPLSDGGFSHHGADDRSFGSNVTGGGGGGSSEHSSGHRMRYEDGNQSRHNGSRGSGGQISPRGPVDSPTGMGGGGGGGGRGYIPAGARSMFPGGPMPPNEPARSALSPRYSPPPPTSPRGHGSEMARGGGGGGGHPPQEIFSASNRESRALEEDSEHQHQIVMGGKPVAKVPPHFKAGIKVLPSDFRMVKLKHKSVSDEGKGESMSDDGYDNNKEVVDRYREMQRAEQGGPRAQPGSKLGGQPYPDVTASAVRGHVSHQDHSRDFQSRWEDDDDEKTRVGAGLFHNDSRFVVGNGDLNYRQEHRNGHHNIGNNNSNNNSNSNNRYSSSGDYSHNLRNQAPPHAHSSHGIGGTRADNSSGSESAGHDPSRFKDLEIANMFSNFRLDENVNHPHSNSNSLSGRRDDLLVSSMDDHGFENGLGYLP
ncbi:hypothetical protein EGW08_002489 [Elysia chlorotica]|uniref:PID domain-containing protein n=1 Tax=Elysia chlorotica TaxID=188477 RepID=A0A3S1BVK4_ELYCH|nr:hypothetical protein EGW08_002489 [Elysia chlorotica]